MLDGSLIFFNLYSQTTKSIPNIKEYQLFIKDNKEWIAFSNEKNTLFIGELDDKSFIEIPKIESYQISPSGKSVIYNCNQQSEEQNTYWLDLTNNKKKLIYKGIGAKDFIFSDNTDQVAFLVRDHGENSIWYCNSTIGKAQCILSNDSLEFESNQNIDKGAYWSFSKDGHTLFFDLSEKISRHQDSINVEIWNYKDAYLWSYFNAIDIRGNPIFKPNSYLCSFSFKDFKLKKLLKKNSRSCMVHFDMTLTVFV